MVIALSMAHQKVIIDLGVKQAEGVINRLIPIDMSSAINIIHSATTSALEDSKYLIVHPATVYPRPNILGN